MVWSDAARFMELAEQSSPAQREEMATLYDGSFLSGFSLPGNSEFDFWLTSQQQQYEGRYLTALKGLIQIKFAVQDLSRAIHYAQRYLAIDELAEDVHQQLIRLYAASGDRSAALRQFEACTLILERELGVEPLPETWAAYEAARSPAVKPAPQVKTQPTWTVLPSLELTLVGRKKAWEALEDSYRRFQQGGLIFIRGEPGIGKSRLLQEFATSQDRLVLSGNSHASTQRLPYEPLTQALRQALSLPQLWVDIRPIWLSEAGRLLPELSDHFPDLPKVIEVEPDQAQARLYEALTQCA
ncbi:MAG: BTAD domain-containing putative transcriptional regulator, partial [Anaerolineales bacterium]